MAAAQAALPVFAQYNPLAQLVFDVQDAPCTPGVGGGGVGVGVGVGAGVGVGCGAGVEVGCCVVDPFWLSSGSCGPGATVFCPSMKKTAAPRMMTAMVRVVVRAFWLMPNLRPCGYYNNSSWV